MGIIRGKIFHPKIYPKIRHVGDPSPWEKCECGKWRSTTPPYNHVEVEELTLREMLERYKIKCPDQKQK